MKYKQNLKVVNNMVYSYGSIVAKIEGKELLVGKQFVKFSPTTSKHINHVASELRLKKTIVYLHDILN